MAVQPPTLCTLPPELRCNPGLLSVSPSNLQHKQTVLGHLCPRCLWLCGHTLCPPVEVQAAQRTPVAPHPSTAIPVSAPTFSRWHGTPVQAAQPPAGGCIHLPLHPNIPGNNKHPSLEKEARASAETVQSATWSCWGNRQWQQSGCLDSASRHQRELWEHMPFFK